MLFSGTNFEGIIILYIVNMHAHFLLCSVFIYNDKTTLFHFKKQNKKTTLFKGDAEDLGKLFVFFNR